jgi:hypothetical protein
VNIVSKVRTGKAEIGRNKNPTALRQKTNQAAPDRETSSDAKKAITSTSKKGMKTKSEKSEILVYITSTWFIYNHGGEGPPSFIWLERKTRSWLTTARLKTKNISSREVARSSNPLVSYL